MKRFFPSVETQPSAKASEKPDSSKPSEVKRRKNRSAPDPKWMDNGNDAWLEYREVNGTLIMFCRWCESKKYTNELAKGTSNYRKQSIDRHLNHHEHKSEAEARRNQNIIRVDFSRNLDTHKIRVITQMQCIYFMAKKYLALSVYPDLYELIDFHRKNSEVMKLCDTPETLQSPSLLTKDLPLESNEYGSHLSNTSAKEMEEAIVYVIEKALCEEIRSSNHWNELTAEAIAFDLKSFIIAKGLKVENLLHFGSDGAATLIGTKTGVVKRFEKINPFITSVHCIAHRLHLAGKDAAKHVPYFNHYETCIKKLYNYFSGSYRRMQNLKMIQETLEDPQLAILNIVNTRWLSMSNSVKNLHQILDSVIDALRYDADLASNLLDELNCDFIISTKYLADLMFILTKLINVFQREYVSFADIKIHLDMVYDAITAQFIRFDGSTPSYSFRIFDPKLLPIKESELGNYGDEDIKKLSDYYGIDKVDEEGNVMEKIVDSDDVKQEWEVAKYYIKQIRSQNAAGGWEYIFNTYPDFVNEFPNIAKLVKISLIIPLSNAQVERIFS
ncbi:unnamed protein product [Rhizophagus irregularis]|nr:unnamed protein product [Rhizophagus irregularis]